MIEPAGGVRGNPLSTYDARPKDSLPPAVSTDQTLAPSAHGVGKEASFGAGYRGVGGAPRPEGRAMRRPDEMARRQRVEKLIGEDEQRRARNFAKGRAPFHGRGRLLQRPRLRFAQNRAGFDEIDGDRVEKSRRHAPDAQHVGHQHAASGPKLHEPRVRRPARGGPRLADPDAEHLAEHLADLRRRDEIARRAERIPGHVIAVPRVLQAQRHVTLQRDRPLVGDDRGYLRSKRVHARASRRFSATDDQQRAGQDHRRRQHHPHGQPIRQRLLHGIGLAEKLAEYSRQPITDAKKSRR